MASFDLTTWAALVGTWVLVVGTLVFAYWQLRQTQRLHSATTLLDLRERFYGPRHLAARRELSTWLLAPQRGEEPENWEVALFFQLIGSLTHTRALDRRAVWHAFGTWVTSYYVFMTQPEDLLLRWRRETNDPLVFAEFEWLAKTMIELDRRASHGPRHERASTDDARYVLEGESHLPGGPAVPAP